VPEPNSDEDVVFEEFFAMGLRMPPHRVLTEILFKFRVQLHQLTPNAIIQMSKYLWAVLSFDGEPSSDGFDKCHELHYQPKKVLIDGFDKYQQFGVVNFHGKRGGEVGIVPATKDKWSTGWTKVWFYCKVPLHPCPCGGKIVHTLRSHMSALNFCTKPISSDTTQDLNDDAFVWASQNIGGRDAVEEFLSCGVWPLSIGVDFEHVKVHFTQVSWLKIPLPNFPLRRKGEKDDVRFLPRVEQEAKNIVGGYTCVEHEACLASIPNNDRLNCVLKLAGVSYGPRPVPVSAEVLKKRKAGAATKVSGKRPKVAEKKIALAMKISGLRAGAGSKRPFGGDVLPVKSAKLSKGVIPRAIASAAAARVMPKMQVLDVSVDAGGAKSGEKHRGSKLVPRTKVAPSAKKCIIHAIGALAALSLDGSAESSPND
jgi:hypothetical protein